MTERIGLYFNEVHVNLVLCQWNDELDEIFADKAKNHGAI